MRTLHFLGPKVRMLRKQNNMTIEDLSLRCVRINPEAAPSVSYLSMIENGRRTPKEATIGVIASVFQKEVEWFLDDSKANGLPDDVHSSKFRSLPLEPSFLFSREYLNTAIPELLVYSGVSGRQFAQLLIRAHQEKSRNNFPELEKAAESVGKKQFPLSLDAVLQLVKQQDLKIHWFSGNPDFFTSETDVENQTIVRSYFEPPNSIFLNSVLNQQPERLKYDLATHIAHRVLHNGDGMRSAISAGDTLRSGIRNVLQPGQNNKSINPADILVAWRDFECSFFAGALLCPKAKFRQFLNHHSYAISSHNRLGVSQSLFMRRVTAVSSYPYWHYFDTYSSGHLRAIYRGNGIPLPWGTLTSSPSFCSKWGLFKLLSNDEDSSISQYSIMINESKFNIYCCKSVKVRDAAGNKHVLCAGIDLHPAISNQPGAAILMEDEIQRLRDNKCGSFSRRAEETLMRIAKLLNISWMQDAISQEPEIICASKTLCVDPSYCD